MLVLIQLFHKFNSSLQQHEGIECIWLVASAHYVVNPPGSTSIMAAHSVLIGGRLLPLGCTTQWVCEDREQSGARLQIEDSYHEHETEFSSLAYPPSFYKERKMKALCECWRAAVEENNTRGRFVTQKCNINPLLTEIESTSISIKISHP